MHWRFIFLSNTVEPLDDLIAATFANFDRAVELHGLSLDVPDVAVHLDLLDDLAGMAFVLFQRYFVAERTSGRQLKDGPKVLKSYTVAELAGAGANYWKHCDEWPLDISALSGLQRRSYDILTDVDAWSTEYRCLDLLQKVCSSERPSLQAVLSLIELRLDALRPAVVDDSAE